MKTCIVTGASGGIGRAIAIALSESGYRVLLQGRNLTKLETLRSELGQHTELLVGDLTLKSDRALMLARAFECEGIDLLVNAAGISHFSAFEAIPDTDMYKMVETNLIAPTLLIKEFIDAKKREGKPEAVSIINVGSAFGYIGYPGFSAYCAAKFGLRGLTESLHREYSDSQFRFGYFAPRATQTDINSAAVNAMNNALGNKVDSPEYVAKQFIRFLNRHRREAAVGWPEKLFVKINMLLPKVVDNAIKSKLPIIKQFMNA